MIVGPSGHQWLWSSLSKVPTGEKALACGGVAGLCAECRFVFLIVQSSIKTNVAPYHTCPRTLTNLLSATPTQHATFLAKKQVLLHYSYLL